MSYENEQTAAPRILIVDDQETVRYFAKEVLMQAGFAVEEADSGAVALELIDRNAPDLVLLDVMMPSMNGYEVCSRLRSRIDIANLPILMMTGLDDEAAIRQAYDSGATDFIGKPLKALILEQRVRHILRAYHSEQRILELAFSDSLTGLSNRESFITGLSQAVASAKRHERLLSVLFLDLDDFKRINDTLGHNSGDRLLYDVANRLRDALRESDLVERLSVRAENQLISRFGGDEFIVCLPEIARNQDAAVVAMRILDSMREPFQLPGHEVFTTTSVGIALFPQDSQDGESLVKFADTAMYAAKSNGKNQYRYFDEAMNQSARRRLDLDSGLRQAIGLDELALNYQPQMDLTTGRITGVEALLRWTSNELGIVSPGEFIPVAEENGLILEIGEWVLSTACFQAKRWLELGHPIARMAVNISTVQFSQKGFVDNVRRILQETGLPASYLEMEITESLLIDDLGSTVRTLKEIRAMGIQLAVDDFGTGFSSLSYLKHFPLNRLKIDQSFVREITEDPHDAAITRAIAQMAVGMDLEVIAEGVETQEQLAFLQDIGCHEAQGYLLSRPEPAKQVEKLLTQTLPFAHFLSDQRHTKC